MTAQPYGNLDAATYQRHLRSAADGVLVALAAGPASATVPGCPGWTAHDVVAHLGQVHAWAALIVDTGRRHNRADLPGVPTGADLAGWYAAQIDQLMEALQATDPDRACWGHQPDHRVAGYWSRRQAHEAAMHRVDVDLAVGLPPRYDAELAVDGVNEVLDVWLPAPGSDPPAEPDRPLLLACTDRPERWLLVPEVGIFPQTLGPQVPEPQAASAAVSISGSAQDLLLALWKRQDSDAARLSVAGDRNAAARFLGATLTP